MENVNIEQLKFPIGKFEKPAIIDKKTIEGWIQAIESFPGELDSFTQNLTVKELNRRYRPNGWSIKQVVHHCADSHMNSFIRFKLTLTEDLPAIRPYFEDRWAVLSDGLEDDIADSINLLKALHRKWVKLLKNLTEEDLKSAFIHPESGKRFSLAENIGIYAWHSNHHLAHIKQALK